MSEQVPEVWEVWHARFDFSEGKGYKFRLVIVLGVHDDGGLVAMITSATSKLSLAHDYAIRDWRAAGLEKPSVARLDRIAEIPAGYLGTAGRIGALVEADIEAIKVVLSEMVR